MPRVSIKKKDYMAQDLCDWIRGKLRRKHWTQKQLGEKINLSQPAMYKRLSNGKFDFAELLVIFKELEATDEEIVKLLRL